MTQPLIPKLIAMVERGDSRLQCSALHVLSELGLKDRKVAAAVGKKLFAEDAHVRQYALRAVAKAPTREHTEALLTLLERGGDTATQATLILSTIGPRVLPVLKKRYQTSTTYYKKLLLTIIGTIKAVDARNFILDIILTEPLDLLKHVCYTVRGHFESLTLPEKKTCFMQIKKRVTYASGKKNYTALTSYAILIGYLQLPLSKRMLLAFVQKTDAAYFYVRRNALLSLSKIHLKGKHDDVAQALFPLLEGGDVRTITCAIDILKSITFAKRFEKNIEQCLRSPFAEVRGFAIAYIGRSDSAHNAQRLMTYLREPDATIRHAVEVALATMPSVVPFLLRSIPRIQDEDEAGRIAQILKMHKNALTAKRCGVLFTQLERALVKKEKAYKYYYIILKTVVPEFLYKSTLKKVQLLKARKKIALALQYATLLTKGLLYTDEVKYECAILHIKQSSHSIDAVYRNNDPGLQLLEYLVKSSDIALLKRIKNERVVDAQDLFYIGFHFAEKLFELREFGVALLRYLVKKYPRFKPTVKAKKKLQQLGV